MHHGVAFNRQFVTRVDNAARNFIRQSLRIRFYGNIICWISHKFIEISVRLYFVAVLFGVVLWKLLFMEFSYRFKRFIYCKTLTLEVPILIIYNYFNLDFPGSTTLFILRVLCYWGPSITVPYLLLIDVKYRISIVISSFD